MAKMLLLRCVLSMRKHNIYTAYLFKAQDMAVANFPLFVIIILQIM